MVMRSEQAVGTVSARSMQCAMPVMVIQEAVRLAAAINEHISRVRQQLDGHLSLPPHPHVHAPEAACICAPVPTSASWKLLLCSS